VDLAIDFAGALEGGHLVHLVSVAARGVLEGTEAEYAEALALLRDVLPSDPPESYDPVPYIEAQSWVFARTMPDNPHEYVLLRRSTDWREHLRFLLWIRVHGEVERFKGRSYRYRTVGQFRYWALGPDDTIINRRREPAPPAPL